MIALVNWNKLVRELIKVLFLINTSRQAPVSYTPLQSPHKRMAVTEVWSDRIFSMNVYIGVL